MKIYCLNNKGSIMLKKVLISLGVVLLLTFASCGGGSSKEAKELLQKILTVIGIPQEVITNICQTSNSSDVCEGMKLNSKTSNGKNKTWQKIEETGVGQYLLETNNPCEPILLELQDDDVIDDNGEFMLKFSGVELGQTTKELSILEAMIDASYISSSSVSSIKSLNSTEAQNSFYTTLYVDLKTNINKLRAGGLTKTQAIRGTLKEMADELSDYGVGQTLPDTLNSCGNDTVCIDNEINRLSANLIIDNSEAEVIVNSQKGNSSSLIVGEVSCEEEKILFKGDNYSIQVNEDSLTYENGKYYLVWSNGIYSNNSLYNQYDNQIKLSTSVDAVNWETKDIFITQYGSYNHKIAIDTSGNIHIVYTETVETGTYGYSNRNLVYITNKDGSFKSTVLESGSGYSFYSPSKLFFTPNGALNLFYQKTGWYRYNAPLYERNLINSQWSDKKIVSNLSYGKGDPDDDENMLLSYDVVDNKKILYISSGYWHLEYHGDIEYSGHIFKYTQNNDIYDTEELSFIGSYFNFKDNNIVYANIDRNELFLNSNSIFSLNNNETITKVMFNGKIIAINTHKKNKDNTYSNFAYILSKSGNIINNFKDGYLVLSKYNTIFVQNNINPKKLIILTK